MAKRPATRSTDQQRGSSPQNSSASAKKKAGRKFRRKRFREVYLVLGVLAALVVIIGGFVLIEHFQSQGTAPAAQPANAGLVEEVTGVSSTVWEAIGTGGVTQPFTTISGSSPLQASNGLPEVLFIGGEFCPNCAAERWAMLNALSRFGTFQHVGQIQSYEDHISTFTFEGSTYSSQYIAFVPREIDGNSVDASSGSYVSLDTLTSAQQQIYSTDDSQGSIPFIDVGNSYKLIGASYEYSTLEDSSSNPLTWDQIASQLDNTSSSVAQQILGTANYLTAAICTISAQQPGSVCNTSVIQQIEGTLGQSASTRQPSAPLAIVSPSGDLPGQSRRLFRA
jgi:hypothetical protein